MDTGEEYYIHLHGAQKGPFTLSQIKSMYDRQYIPEETLYWQDSMEQWRHVSDLCGPPAWRLRERRWVRPATALVVLMVLAVLLKLFLPVTLDAWRESWQHEYTEKAAYWKAREYIRRGLKRSTDYVRFDPFDASRATLERENEAVVRLSGETSSDKRSTKHSWKVFLRYSAQNRDWVGTAAYETKAGP